LLAVNAAAPKIVQACRLFPSDSTDRYVVFQNSIAVGSQSLTFFHDESGLVVATQMNLNYRNDADESVSFVHGARETWVGGWLHAFDSTTRHGDHALVVEARTVERATLLVHSSAFEHLRHVSGYLVPGNLWHRDARLHNVIMDLVDGTPKLVKVFYDGKELLPSSAGAQVANHYRLRGEFNRDAWYTEDCRLARMTWPLRGAAPLTFDLVSV
jgi:hypothetical protein